MSEVIQGPKPIASLVILDMGAAALLVNAGLMNHTPASPAQAVAVTYYYDKAEVDKVKSTLAFAPDTYILTEYPSASATPATTAPPTHQPDRSQT